jgi:sugar phosphate isomerase/epimerase
LANLGVITDGISREFEHALNVMREHDLRHAELQYVWDSEVGDLDDSQIGRVRDLVRHYGVRVSCVSRHNFAGMGVGSTAVGDKAHSLHMEALRRCIAEAKALDCGLVRIMSFRKEMILFGSGGAEDWNVATGAWDKLKLLLEPAVQLAEREGVTLAVETGNNAMVTSAWLGRKLVEEIGSDCLRVLWDPGNSLYCAEAAFPDGYEALRGCLAHVHIKDLRVDIPKATVEQCRFGTGQMAPYLEDIAAALERDRFSGVVSFESVHRPAGGSFADGFRAAFPAFRRIFG